MPTIASLSGAQLDSVNSILVNEAGRIGPDIYTKSLNTSAWINLAQRGAFPDEMGDVINVLTWERSLPGALGAGLNWTDVNTQTYFNNDGNPGNGSSTDGSPTSFANPNTCLPTAVTIGFGQTVRSYGLKQAAVQSPKICVHDLRFAAKRKDQLTAMFNILKDNTKWAWESYYRSAYADMAEHKVLVTSTLANVDGAETWPTPDSGTLAAMRHISQGILDRIYLKLVREGAEPWGMENGRPVYAVVLSPEAQEFLFRGIGALNLRDDFRYNNSRVNELLAPLGVERSYKGWFYLVDMFPRRFNIDLTLVGANRFKEILPFTPVEATNGRKFVLNLDYELADIEEAYIYVREALEFQVPKAITAPGGGTAFTAQNYMGDFRWLNIPNETTNPDGTIGFFRGVMSCATKPVSPDLATVIRFKRCIPSAVGLACDATSDPTPTDATTVPVV
jgi:hypothetical protein